MSLLFNGYECIEWNGGDVMLLLAVSSFWFLVSCCESFRSRETWNSKLATRNLQPQIEHPAMSTPIRPVFRELLTLNLASLARLAFPASLAGLA
jgi:hypothetical protein